MRKRLFENEEWTRDAQRISKHVERTLAKVVTRWVKRYDHHDLRLVVSTSLELPIILAGLQVRSREATRRAKGKRGRR